MWRDFTETLDRCAYQVITGSVVLVATLMLCWLVAAERREPSGNAAVLADFPDHVKSPPGVSFGTAKRHVDTADELVLVDGEDAGSKKSSDLPQERCSCCSALRPVVEWVTYGVADELDFTEETYQPETGDRLEWKVVAATKGGVPLIGVWYPGTLDAGAGMDVGLFVNGVSCGEIETRALDGNILLAALRVQRMIHAEDVIVLRVRDPKSVGRLATLQPAGLHERPDEVDPSLESVDSPEAQAEDTQEFEPIGDTQ